MSIQVLSEELASQIAAGEVVERPASVVKELLENAIDAGASRISIRVEDAGKKKIEVSDDGTGIPIDELPLAVSRHATSKINTAEDLFHIRTLGFRGEALASIGSVSRLMVLSRNADSQVGARIMVEGGRIVSKEMTGSVTGTIVRVSDLFYNTPARLKFLKRDVTERQQIDTLVSRYAMAYAGKAIHLEHDGKAVLRTSGNGERREVLAQLYGIELARQLLEVVFEEEGMKIEGYISPVSISRSNRKDMTFFINGRWVQDVTLVSALLKAYQTYLMVGRYPLSILFIEIPPEAVDVNVHPAKAEVRFREPDRVFTAVQRAARRALMAYVPIPPLAAASWSSQGWNPSPELDGTWMNARPVQPQSTGQPQPMAETPLSSSVEPAPFAAGIPLLRLVGQIGATYLVAEGPDGLYLIDQHAAHERVLYEKMQRQKENIPTQPLLEPLLIQLPPQSAQIICDNLQVLRKIGFHLEEFGRNSFRLSAIPALFTQKDPRAAINSVVEDFEEDEEPLKEVHEDRLIARICKRMAVKGGSILSTEEQQALLRDLESCSSPRTCPHGRPTMIHLSVELLERQFGRRGARSAF
ncbi:MAG TPA: DNA mismatch repair endonuclease MutL [Anaerolineaceae bacterium]|nr:DNA mismatch repair endonuclease MutL [Anaerolineaceae bacterium]HPD62943.1 DNA mismatch repair endonuclease MutL [Anaerolineaceae bacterium]HRS74170.1 DNA mismatch repair endonuclease MutL [Anaerolineaceae bacterium]